MRQHDRRRLQGRAGPARRDAGAIPARGERNAAHLTAAHGVIRQIIHIPSTRLTAKLNRSALCIAISPLTQWAASAFIGE